MTKGARILTENLPMIFELELERSIDRLPDFDLERAMQNLPDPDISDKDRRAIQRELEFHKKWHGDESTPFD